MATPASAQPYQPGSKLNIRNHTPPPPYGAYYENPEPLRAPVIGLVDEFDRHQVDHLDFVLLNPPLETDAPAEAQFHVLTLVHIISHKPKEDGGGPIVAVSHLDTDTSR